MGSLALFTFLALLAEILGTIGGFGSSMFFVPLAGFFFDFRSVLGITAVFHLSSNVSKIALFRNGIDWKLVLRIGIPAVLCVIIGAYLSRFADSGLLELLLAIFLISLSLLFLLRRKLTVKPHTRNAVIGGALSGITAGLLGTGGAIRGVTLSAFDLEKEKFIAVSAVIDLGIDLSRSVVYYSNGYIHGHDLYLVPVLLVVSIAGTWIGKRLLTRFTHAQFKTAVLGLTLLTGLIALVKSLTGR